MSLAVFIMLVIITVIIAALAFWLIRTIFELVKINRGLGVVIGSVGEIVAKTAPINGVVDAINSNLVAGRDLLENLFLKKAGNDAGGLVESLFPGEGAKFLQRVGRSGPVINTGVVYTRGVGILASLGRGAPIGAAHAKGPAVRDPKYATTAAAMLYPRPGGDPRARPKSPVVGKDSPLQYESSATPGVRPQPRQGSDASASGSGVDPSTGRIVIRQTEHQAAAPQEQAEAPPPAAGGEDGGSSQPARLDITGKRPWES